MGKKTMKIMEQDAEKWRRRDDACILMRAKEIEADKKRLSGAKKEVGAMIKEKEKELLSAKKLVGKTANKKIVSKSKKK